MIADRGTDRGDSSGSGDQRTAADDPVVSIQAALAELVAQAGTYLAAKRDLLQLRLRTLAIVVVIGCLALVTAISLVATAAVLLVVGVAGALAAAFDIPLWAGQLITSLTAGVVGTLLIYTTLIYLRHSSLQRTIARYEHRRRPHHAPQSRGHAPASATAG